MKTAALLLAAAVAVAFTNGAGAHVLYARTCVAVVELLGPIKVRVHQEDCAYRGVISHEHEKEDSE